MNKTQAGPPQIWWTLRIGEFGISAKGRTADLVTFAPNSSRRPGELVGMFVCPLKVGKSRQYLQISQIGVSTHRSRGQT